MRHGAGAVRVGEVGDGELALFGKAGVAVRASASCQSHTSLPSTGSARTCRSGDLGNAVDVAQGLSQLKFGVVVQPPRKGVDDFLLGRPVPARARAPPG